jgi:hypothetical protein
MEKFLLIRLSLFVSLHAMRVAFIFSVSSGTIAEQIFGIK